MSTKKTRRGRPKGTGIDDRASLLKIAALIAVEPGLRPTTAIKKLGITEPSVIRRLRDKFKKFREDQFVFPPRVEDRVPLSAAVTPKDQHAKRGRSKRPQAAKRAKSLPPRAALDQPTPAAAFTG